MKRFIAYISLIVFSLTAMHAARLTPKQALDRALDNGPTRVTALAGRQDYKLQYSKDNSIYLFTAPQGGFLVVSGDDNAPSVLAYSDSGAFDICNIPPAVQAWIDNIAIQIKDITPGASPRKESPARESITPMLTTEWNQTDPFNRMCPVGINGERCLTGCTATAMAQIMNYHKSPERGDGQISYKTSTEGHQVNVDFSTITFDWLNMVDIYTTESPEIECNAVAQLMFAAGASAEADYRTNETGASIDKAARALYTNFGYDQGLRTLSSYYYTVGQWEEAMYNGLRDFGPVLCSGNTHLLNQVSQGNGHAYVCDGYADGYFHINWGWGGKADGYYLLSALNPLEGQHGYSYRQNMITGITKPKEGSVIFSAIVNKSDLGAKSAQEIDNDDHNVELFGRFENDTRYTVYNGKLGVKLTGADNSEYIIMDDRERRVAFFSSCGNIRVTIDNSIPDGQYIIVPVYQMGTDILDIMTAPQYIGKLRLDKAGSELHFSEIKEHAYVRAEDVSIDSPLYIECPFRVSATLKNTGDIPVSVRTVPVLLDSENKYVGGGDPYYAIARVLAPKESAPVVFTSYLKKESYRLKPGKYTLYFANAYHVENSPLKEDDYLSEGITVSVNEKPAETIMTVTSFKVENADNVDPGNVNLAWRVTCNKGYYSGKLKAIVYAAEGGYPVAEASTDYIFLDQGKTQNMTLTFPMTDTGISGRYWTALLDMNNNKWVTEQCYFTTKGNTGLPSLYTEHDPCIFPTITDGTVHISGNGIRAVNVYSITGALQYHVEGSPSMIDLTHLSAGVHIIQIMGDKPTVIKIIKK